MGNKICSECRPNAQDVPYLVNVPDRDEPESTYATQENVHYDVPCNVNHLITDLPEMSKFTVMQKLMRNWNAGGNQRIPIF